MEDVEMVEILELQYSDVMVLSSTSNVRVSSSSSSGELQRLDCVSRTIMETLGPGGSGLLSISGVPNASSLRRRLLPLARKLALLNHEDRKGIIKEHNLGSDVSLKNLDRSVSSFAMQLKYMHDSQTMPTYVVECQPNSGEDQLGVLKLREFQDNEFKSLGDTFKELGFCMMELGLCIARICDRAIGGEELEQSLLESCTAKGRLIHYHSIVDNLAIREAGTKKWSTKRVVSHHTNGNEVKECEDHSPLWQQWHYDYGVFTVLTDPLFLLASHLTESKDRYSSSCSHECTSPSGHSYLQIFDPTKNKVFSVKNSSESFIIQVGESADIISKGKLRSTLHSVCRPAKFENLSRETFVVFLQPAWNKTFSMKDYPINQFSESSDEETHPAVDNQDKLTQEIQRIVPPLSSRMKDGMTFAEFSRETTKQYYGNSGLQSNRQKH